jgi:phospholipid transport system substrate-binding protein
MTMAIFQRASARSIGWLGVALAAALFLLPVRADAATASAVDAVRSFYDALLGTMKNAAGLGMRGRYEKLEPVIRETFALPYMARMAVGPAWAQLGEPQRDVLTKAFGRYIAATYAENFDGYAGEELQVGGEQRTAFGNIVQSRIVKPGGAQVTINYLAREEQGNWQIADVYLAGTISELAVRRSEFSAILRNDGVDGLIAALNEKTAMLVRAVARS